MASGAAPDAAGGAAGVVAPGLGIIPAACMAAVASATVGILIVVPSSTALFYDSPFAAASARVEKLLAAAIDHSVSPGRTMCGTDACAGAARARTDRIRTADRRYISTSLQSGRWRG